MTKTDYCVLILFSFFYLLILFCDQCPYINLFRFFLVCLCLLPAFYHGVFLASFFTMVSDAFLLFSPYPKTGVYFFCFVHLFYISSLLHKHLSYSIFFFLLFFLLFPIPIIGIVYGMLFFIHTTVAFFLRKEKKAKPTFGLYLFGLFLFICCDTLVAIGHFSNPNPTLIWTFYAPSQLLLAFNAKALPPLPVPFSPDP